MSKTLVETIHGKRLVETTVVKSRETSRKRGKSREMERYRIEAVDAPNGDFFLHRPKDLEPIYNDLGQVMLGYDVNILHRTCNCWVWIRSKCDFGVGDCKHLIYVTDQVERSLRMLGIWPSQVGIEDAVRRHGESVGLS